MAAEKIEILRQRGVRAAAVAGRGAGNEGGSVARLFSALITMRSQSHIAKTGRTGVVFYLSAPPYIRNRCGRQLLTVSSVYLR